MPTITIFSTWAQIIWLECFEIQIFVSSSSFLPGRNLWKPLLWAVSHVLCWIHKISVLNCFKSNDFYGNVVNSRKTLWKIVSFRLKCPHKFSIFFLSKISQPQFNFRLSWCIIMVIRRNSLWSRKENFLVCSKNCLNSLSWEFSSVSKFEFSVLMLS